MAKVVIGAEVEVKEGSAVKSVGNIRKELKLAQKDAIALADTFGVTSREAIEAAKKVAKLKDSIQDAKELSDAFNPATRFQAFSGAINAAVGGFTALTGAQALFGEKSEEVEKVLLKVQSALALSQGISSILDAGGAFNTLAAVIKSKVITAFSTLRAAIISTGIGALVVGIGLLIANFSKVKSAIVNIIPGMQQFFDFVGGIVDKVKEWVGVTEDEIDSQAALKDATQELTEALSKYYDQIDRVTKIERLRAQIAGKTQAEIDQIDIDGIEKKKKNIEGLIGLAKQYGIATVTLEAERQKLIEDIEVRGLERRVKISEKQRQEADRAAEERKRKAEGIEKFSNDLEMQGKIRQQKELENLERLNEIYRLEEEAENEKNKSIAENRVYWEKFYVDLSIKFAEEKKQIEEEAYKTRVAQLNEIGQATNKLGDIVGKQTAVGKALGIATTLINTYTGATEVLRAKSTLPEPLGTASKLINFAAVIATGFKAIKAITAVQVPGGGGGAPSIQAPIAPQLQTTNLNQGSINQLNNASNRTFVVESDISGSQDRIRRLNRAARIN